MGLVFNSGENKLLAKLLASETFTAHLFVNNHTPAPGDALTDYTEASFSGYAAQILTGWSTVATNSAGKAEASAAQVTFTMSMTMGTATVEGWYVTDQDGTLIGADLFAGAPLSLSQAGDNVKLTVTLTLTSE